MTKTICSVLAVLVTEYKFLKTIVKIMDIAIIQTSYCDI